MTIDAEISEGNMLMLEESPLPPTPTPTNRTTSASSLHTASSTLPLPNNLTPRFTANLKDLKLHIDRDTPPSKTHNHINELGKLSRCQRR